MILSIQAKEIIKSVRNIIQISKMFFQFSYTHRGHWSNNNSIFMILIIINFIVWRNNKSDFTNMCVQDWQTQVCNIYAKISASSNVGASLGTFWSHYDSPIISGEVFGKKTEYKSMFRFG